MFKYARICGGEQVRNIQLSQPICSIRYPLVPENNWLICANVWQVGGKMRSSFLGTTRSAATRLETQGKFRYFFIFRYFSQITI